MRRARFEPLFGWLLSILLGLAVACGRVDRDRPGSPSAGEAGLPPMPPSGGSGGAPMGTGGAGAGSGGLGGEAGSTPSCLYPRRGLVIEPSRGDKPPTRYGFTRYPIDRSPLESELAAAYDFNGDAISDLIVRDSLVTPPRFRLLLTSPPPEVFDLVLTDCDALRQLPDGRLLLRDLNGDEVPDFVVGTTAGVEAFFNEEGGLRHALSYRLSPAVRAPLINLGVGDLNGDDGRDILVSFDRLISEASIDLDIRTQSFFRVANGFASGPVLETPVRGDGSFVGINHRGYFAVGRFRPGELDSALVVGSSTGSGNRPFVLKTSFDGEQPEPLISGVDEAIHQVLPVPRFGVHALVLAVGDDHFYVLDLAEATPSAPPRIVTQGDLASEGGESHELGGGREIPRYFLYDIDRDDDLDFIERVQDGLALHGNHGNGAFDAPQQLDVTVFSEAESPFLQVGPGSAIVSGPGPTGEGEVAIYALYPEP